MHTVQLNDRGRDSASNEAASHVAVCSCVIALGREAHYNIITFSRSNSVFDLISLLGVWCN